METITLSSRNPLLLNDVALGSEPDFPVEAELYLPLDRSRQVPGVVVMEGLGGLQDSRERGYGRKLAAEGYAAVVVDSFGSRGVGDNGDVVRAYSVSESMMLSDAFAALDYLRARQDVDASRVAIMGFSFGGMVASLTGYEQIARLFMPDGGRFAAHLSYYGCSIPRMQLPLSTGAPHRLLLGGLDRNICIPRTRRIAEDLRRGGADVDVTVFDGTYHQWDGSDEKKRFVPFNLRRLHARVTPDYQIKDERTGMTFGGKLSRMAIIALWTSFFGYVIKSDPEIAKRSDEILFRTLQAM